MAGKVSSTAASCVFSILSFKPTLVLASNAACSKSAMLSIFLRLIGSSQADLLAIKTVLV